MAAIQGLEHVGIAAKDTVALKDWYVKYLGCEVVYDNKKSPPTFFVRLKDDSMIEIYPQSEDAPTGINTAHGIRHLALACSDFDAAVKVFQDAGVEVVTPPAMSDKGIGTFFFRDPEGNILHLIARKTPLF